MTAGAGTIGGAASLAGGVVAALGGWSADADAEGAADAGSFFELQAATAMQAADTISKTRTGATRADLNHACMRHLHTGAGADCDTAPRSAKYGLRAVTAFFVRQRRRSAHNGNCRFKPKNTWSLGTPSPS